MHRQIYTLLLCVFVLSMVKAQDAKTVTFKNELSFGGGIHTRGYNLSTIFTINQTSTKAFTALLEFSEIKSPKEHRLTTEALTIGGNSTRSYIYGKQNNLFVVRMGAGQRYYISERPQKSVVSMAFVYSAGLSLGMMKPYYLDLIYTYNPDGYSIRSERYTEVNKNKFLDPTEINGATGFGAGWDELSLAPGLYGKAGLIFDWGPNDDFSKIMEVGVSLDAYFRNIPILVDEVKAPFFFNIYLNFYFGKRWK